MNMEKVSLGIVAAEFNYDITNAMVELAKEHAQFLGAEVKRVVKVPGVFDMPLMVKKLLEKKDVDAVVTLGAVIEGQTEHDEVVMGHASRKIADLALQYDKPTALGISGPGMSRLEAHKRVEYAKRAVEAAVKGVKTLRQLK
jgi:6,7-dimethyl-8-ribityllumazine synthase